MTKEECILMMFVMDKALRKGMEIGYEYGKEDGLKEAKQ